VLVPKACWKQHTKRKSWMSQNTILFQMFDWSSTYADKLVPYLVGVAPFCTLIEPLKLFAFLLFGKRAGDTLLIGERGSGGFIDWRSGFIFTPTVQYPSTGITLIILKHNCAPTSALSQETHPWFPSYPAVRKSWSISPELLWEMPIRWGAAC
jgi:hypothetical protein